MTIVPCSNETMAQAEALVHSVFPWMTPLERMSFVTIKRPDSFLGRLIRRVAGVKSLVAFDAYLDDKNSVRGTTGLYCYEKDAHEAVWVAWFCVDPAARGQGIGQALIDHTVKRARKAGFNKVRLYTSSDPNEEAAQRLYEKNGFKEVRRERKLFTTLIFRERTIAEAEQSAAASPGAAEHER